MLNKEQKLSSKQSEISVWTCLIAKLDKKEEYLISDS